MFNNAAFLDSAWFSQIQTPANIKIYVEELSSKNIKYQFADIGVLNDNTSATNSKLAVSNYVGLATWIKNSRLVDSNQLIIATLNFGHRFNRINGVKVANPNFGNQTFLRNLNSLVNTLVNVGVKIGNRGEFYKVDGVHLDFEGFISNDETLLTVLTYLRESSLISNEHFSISAPADPSYNGEFTYQWDDDYIGKVASIVNTINPMMYDAMGWGSDVTNIFAYQLYCANEIKRYKAAIEKLGVNNITCRLLPTLPSYEMKVSSDNTIYHDPKIENLEFALRGIISVIQLDRHKIIEGVGIFWWSSFIDRCADFYDPTLDQKHWNDIWINSLL